MRYAIVESGKVVNVAEGREGWTPPGDWVRADNARIGQDYRDGKFSDPTIVKTTNDTKSDIAARRYREETKGFTLNDATIKTDRESQALITGAVVAAKDDPDYICKWKALEGFITLDATAIITIGRAVRTHVQACFDREAELVAEVDAGTFTSDMLDKGWP